MLEIFFFFFFNWIIMGQYASTQPCATKFRRSACTIFVLDDENGHNISNKRDCNVGSYLW